MCLLLLNGSCARLPKFGVWYLRELTYMCAVMPRAWLGMCTAPCTRFCKSRYIFLYKKSWIPLNWCHWWLRIWCLLLIAASTSCDFFYWVWSGGHNTKYLCYPEGFVLCEYNEFCFSIRYRRVCVLIKFSCISGFSG